MAVSTLLSFNIALAALYAFLCLFEGFQLLRIVYYRHKILSFQFGFLVLCFFWALLRALFFGFFMSLGNIPAYLIVYWSPINIQFATFSLLVVYYAHLHHKQKSEWYSLKRRYTGLWATLNCLFLLLAISWLILGAKYDHLNGNDVVEPQWLTSLHLSFSGLVFLLLSIVIGWHAWRAANLMKESEQAHSQPKFAGKLSLRRILMVSILLFLLFAIRCFYDFIVSTNILATWHIEVSSGTTFVALLTFIVFFIFEIIPTILVLALFGQVQATTLGAFSKSTKYQFGYQILSNSRQSDDSNVLNGSGNLIKADLFNNPLRYDSDEENTPFKSSPSPSSLVYGTNSPYSVTPIHTTNNNDDMGT